MTMMTLVLVAASALVVPSAPLTWEICAPETGTECATLRLPVDWDDPGGETFGFRIARHAATDQEHRIGTLIFGTGGPGDPGLRAAKQLSRFSDEQIRRFDIVSYDPRGVARATRCPARCRRPR
ncbi:hypothetical protein [Actinoplanes sp. NPDC051494]|uniref:hypothetical protein n=1 Tax=Actinoplanes sp. NPDC051494 TaxID=3363907 RepID=UPI003792FF0E